MLAAGIEVVVACIGNGAATRKVGMALLEPAAGSGIGAPRLRRSSPA
jgi:hypothetical protein